MLRTKRRGKITLQEIGIAAGIVLCLAFAVFYQNRRFESLGFRAYIFQQRIKLPSAEVLKFITLGYDNIYANWLWLQSIQAFGSGWRTEDGTTKPIVQYFDTMTEMDPKFIPSYRFGNLVVGDHRGDYEGGRWILEKGAHKNILNHDIPYLGMYNAIWMQNDLDDARWFARRVRRIPDAPNFIARMEEYIERSAGRLDVAFEFNVRYFVQYMTQNNEVERQIIAQRMQKLLDDWYLQRLGGAAKLYYEEHGEHPAAMEQILDPKYLETFIAPTLAAFQQSVEGHDMEIARISAGSEIPDSLIASIINHSKERIEGLPPNPFGFWYMIWTPAREFLVETETEPKWDKLHYIVSAWDLVQEVNQRAIQAQTYIMEYHSKNESKLPSDEEMEEAGLLGRDPLGGHYVYDRNDPASPVYGGFYSTATRRIDKKEEPRIGLRGRGPFPFTVEPKLSDNEVDFRWGVENGLINLTTGEELWYKPGQEPDWDAYRPAKKPDQPVSDGSPSQTDAPEEEAASTPAEEAPVAE